MAKSSTSFSRDNSAAIKHGVHSVKRNGRRAMTPDERSIANKIYDQSGDLEGVIEGLRTRAERAELLARMAESYITQQQKAGEELWELPIWRIYGTLAGEARRCWTALVDLVPDNRQAYEAEYQKLDDVLNDTS